MRSVKSSSAKTCTESLDKVEEKLGLTNKAIEQLDMRLKDLEHQQQAGIEKISQQEKKLRDADLECSSRVKFSDTTDNSDLQLLQVSLSQLCYKNCLFLSLCSFCKHYSSIFVKKTCSTTGDDGFTISLLGNCQTLKPRLHLAIRFKLIRISSVFTLVLNPD